MFLRLLVFLFVLSVYFFQIKKQNIFKPYLPKEEYEGLYQTIGQYL